MYCSKCATPLPDDAIVCYKCAHPVYSAQPQQPAKVKSQYSGLGITAAGISGGFLVVISLLVIIGGVIFFASQINKTSTSTTSFPSSNSTTTSQTDNYSSDKIQVAPKNKQRVVDQTFYVGARTFQYFPVSIIEQAHLTGRFSAQGGKNDINCIIVDEDNFENVKNGTVGRSYLHSGYSSRGKIDLRLPAGNYYIIFDNRLALLTNKTVTAQIDLEY